MKKCLLITLRDIYNYGNRLQNYAAAHVLKSMGYEVVCFDHRRFITRILRILRMAIRGNFGLAHRLILCEHLDGKMCRYICTVRKAQKHSDEFDCFICGSDQIWHPGFAGKPFHFAAFTNSKEKISFAASFGVAEIPEAKKDAYRKYLGSFKRISVREQAGRQIVKELTGTSATVVLDPTLMLDYDYWHAFSKKPRIRIKENYLFVYHLGALNQERKEYIDRICKSNNLRLISLCETEPNEYWYKTSAAGMLWLIEHAAAVITDSFHCSVFSIIMQKPFVVMDRANMGSRIDTLLTTFQLEDRKFAYQTSKEIWNVSFSHVQDILKTEREKTRRFLKDAIEG